jgi:uncharacterized protein YggE
MSRKLMLGLMLMAAAATSVEARPRPDMSTPPDVTLSKEVGWTNVSPYDKAPWWMNSAVITQTGFVYAEIPANRASFSARFQTTADTVEKAQAKAIEQTRALNQALDKLGKDAVRVTTGFSMRALYEEYRDKTGTKVEDQRADKINGYEVSLNLSLEVRDVAALEKAYALVLAASPSSTGNVYFSLQPSNEQNSWMYTEAVKDAHARALASAEAAGGHLGAIKLIDPTGRACQTDILARGAVNQGGGTEADEVVVTGVRRAMPAMMGVPAPPPPPPPPGSAEALEAQALKNPFIQTPPLQRLDATACVVYALN